MDLERAMEFMLEHQAQMQARHERMQAQQERMQAQQERMQAQQDRLQVQQERMQAQLEQSDQEHRERIAKLEKLFLRGAKMIVINRKATNEADERINVLIHAQQAHEEDTRELKAILTRFIESMRRAGNGH